MPVLEDGTGAIRTDYTLDSYTWTYPTGAVKGYGTFTRVFDGPSDQIGHWEFTGPPIDTQSSATGSIAQTDHENPGWGYTFDDLNYQNSPTVPDTAINQFFWGPDAVGANTINVRANFVKIVNGTVVDTFAASTSMTYNVVRPTGSIYNTALGTAGVSAVMSSTGTQYIQIDKNRILDANSNRISGPSGFSWSATVTHR